MQCQSIREIWMDWHFLIKNLEPRKKSHFIHVACIDWVFRNDGFSFFWNSNCCDARSLSGNTKSFVIHAVWLGVTWKSGPLDVLWSYIMFRIPLSSLISSLGALEKSESESFPKTFESQARFLLLFSILSNIDLIGSFLFCFQVFLVNFLHFFWVSDLVEGIWWVFFWVFLWVFGLLFFMFISSFIGFWLNISF